MSLQSRPQRTNPVRACRRQFKSIISPPKLRHIRQRAAKSKPAKPLSAAKPLPVAKPIYQPLDKEAHETRVISLQPSADFSAPIECTLRRTSLKNENLFYIALSYAWGDAKITTPILVNGEHRQVTTNLVSALRHLRGQSKEIILWADAVCINQSDVSERGHHLQLMRDIYRKAAQVVVWLGEAQGINDDFMEWMKLGSTIREDDNLLLTVIERLGDEMYSHFREAMRKLFQRDWWTRLWVIQEFLLAENVVFRCGHGEMALEEMGHMITALVRTQLFTDKRDESLSLACVINPNILTLAREQWRSESSNKRDLLSLLEQFLSFASTDPRDRIYGLLGLAEDAKDFGIPCYLKSVSEVYTEFALCIIQRDRNLRILYSCNNRIVREGYSTDLPSWVPNWAKSPKQSDFWQRYYRAASDSMTIYRFSHDFKTLYIRGIIYDKVSIFGVSRRAATGRNEQQWKTFCGQSQQLYKTGITQLQALFRTLLADYIHHGRLVPNTAFFDAAAAFLCELSLHADPPGRHIQQAAQLENDPDYIAGLLRWRGESRNGRSDQEILEPFLGIPNSCEYIEWPTEEREMTKGQRSLRFYKLWRRVGSKGLRLFRTHQGLMGLSSEETRRGDLVCVLLGCNAPFILRRIDSHYILIGVCFVLGLMDGEAMRDLKEGKVFLQEFNIS